MSESNILEFTQSLMTKGDFQAAEEALRMRLRMPPAPQGAHLLLTNILIHEAKFADAAQLVNEHPENANIFVRLRDYFIGERMNDAALNLIAKSRFSDPGIAHINDSIRKQLSGDISGAIAACNNALRFNVEDASAYNQLGRVLFNAGHPPQSQSAFEKALALKPDFAEALHNLGHVLRAQNKLEESEIAYRRSVEMAPYYRSAWLNMGVVKFARGKNSEALECFEKLLAIEPGNVDAHINAGVARHMLHEVEQARFHYRQAVAIDSKNVTALRHLATLSAEESDTESAIDYFRQSLAINPRMGDVWAELVDLYLHTGKADEALRALTEATRILPNDANVQYISAKLARCNRQFEQSVATFRKMDSRQLHPRFFQSFHFEFASALDAAGEYDAAFKIFEKANALAAGSIRTSQTDFGALDRHMDAVEQWLSGNTSIPKYEKHEDLGEDLCFIIGFPGSGIDLLESLMKQHPKIRMLKDHPGFERVAFAIDSQFGGYPFGIDALDSTQRDTLREQYRASLENDGIQRKGDIVVMDAMSTRTVHAACIHRLFPRAKFLFSLRHPCDVILGNYMQNAPADETSVHFNSLAETARIYGRVMHIWKASADSMPLPVHFSKYEKLVSDKERSLQEVCRFLDLPWTDGMLATQGSSKKPTRKKESAEIRITGESAVDTIHRWTHYRDRLAPYLDKIKPYADYFSYSLD